MNPDPSEASIVKLQSDQFIIKPIAGEVAADGVMNRFSVDLARQSCQCEDFSSHRKAFPIGDPRRFCSHLIQARCRQLDDLPPFLQSLLEACEANGKGMPNGAQFAFFELNGRLGFFGDNRDQSSYFFVTGIGGQLFHEFTYDRKQKSWLGDPPDSADKLIVFAFKERGQYVTSPPKTPPKNQKRSRSRGKTPTRETPAAFKYLALLLVAAGLIAGGYYLFKDGTPDWLAKLVGTELPASEAEQTHNPTKEELIAEQKRKSALKSNADDKNPSNASIENFPKQQNEVAANESQSAPIEVSPATVEEKPPKPQLEYRSWTTADNKFSVSARYISYQNGTITLEREDNSKRVKIDEARLSADDQSYLKDVRRERRLQRARDKKNQSSNSK
jgi:hypothetical protein